MKNKSRWFEKHSKLSLFFVVLGSLIISVVAIEPLFRFALFLKAGPELQRVRVVPDETLGWVLNTQIRDLHTENRCGESVITHPPSHPLIIKYPKYDNAKRILFVGDSFTHAHEVSTGEAYYDVFEELAKDEYSVYAAGVGGYGNVQEYLAIKNIYDEVKPDIIIWQLSGNDPTNHIFELEHASWDNNNQLPRPYFDLMNNNITIRNPSFWLLEHSCSFKYLFSKLLAVDWTYNLGIYNAVKSSTTLDSEIRAEKIKSGLEVTDRVVSMAIAEFPDTQFIGFSVDPGYEDDFKNIFITNGGNYLSKVYENVNNIDNTNCTPLDAHWNHKGNRVAGEELYRLLGNISIK